MIVIRDKNGNELFTVSDALFPLRFDVSTIYGKKKYVVNMTYCPDIDPMQANDKVKSCHMTAEVASERDI